MTGEAPRDSAEEAHRLKSEARAVWSSGNYDAVANGILEVGRDVVEVVGIRPGERVLDIACGTGNAAIPAALAGGRVVGLDLTPEMFAAAGQRAVDAGVEIRWVEGDAEALPYEDGSYDVALSTFGLMFAPRHRVAATEMARVVRDGGRIGLANWAPEGTVGSLFGVLERHLSAAGPSPLLWGREAHVRECFAGTGLDLHFERRALRFNPDIDVEQAAGFYLGSFGPLVRARERLGPEGRWQAAADELVPVIENMMRTPPEYLLVTGTKLDGAVRRGR